MSSSTLDDTPIRIWAIVVLQDGTIVTGNSIGNTEFWDSKLGVQIQSINTHVHDITCIAVHVSNLFFPLITK